MTTNHISPEMYAQGNQKYLRTIAKYSFVFMKEKVSDSQEIINYFGYQEMSRKFADSF